jgi:hypothetical protein
MVDAEIRKLKERIAELEKENAALKRERNKPTKLSNVKITDSTMVFLIHDICKHTKYNPVTSTAVGNYGDIVVADTNYTYYGQTKSKEFDEFLYGLPASTLPVYILQKAETRLLALYKVQSIVSYTLRDSTNPPILHMTVHKLPLDDLRSKRSKKPGVDLAKFYKTACIEKLFNKNKRTGIHLVDVDKTKTERFIL